MNKMKKHILSLALLLAATMAWAVPAKRGQWRTLQLTDGTEVRAQLAGDEHMHFWEAEDGTRYVPVDDTERFRAVDKGEIASRAMARRAKMKNGRRLRSPRQVVTGERTHYVGQKKGLVILAQYTDVKFAAADDKARYERILNAENYSEGNFKGSVADYFRDQSAGQFELTFDVVGPYTMTNNQRYYGKNDSEGYDILPHEMIIEACKQADAEVNYADYDWDGDGEVDQVFVVYAGKGEANGGGVNTVWPHMWYLSEATDSTLTLDGLTIDTYACSSELSGSSIDGIGTFCHEFSHCMGFPDFYDIDYGGWFGMDDFDLMSGGNYLGNSFRPCGYTAHEKMMCGWQEPTVLADNDTIVSDMKPMSNHGETFIIYNDAHPDEYYMLENRQLTGWDSNYPTRGMMITHVDFDMDIWQANVPNTKVIASKAEDYGLPHGKGNDHQRMTIFHADNTESVYTTGTDLYPFWQRDSLTATSTPAAKLYNANADGKKLMKGAILDIVQNSDGTMGFRYRSGNTKDDDDPGTDEPGTDDPGTDVPDDGVLFYESFDQCTGKGGNDGIWETTIASSAFTPDHEDWVASKAYGGSQCAKFGSGSVVGVVHTPLIDFDGEVRLTFKAAAWNNDGNQLGLTLSTDGNETYRYATITPDLVEMKSFEWTDYSIIIKAEGRLRITFLPDKRFLLDEVKVEQFTETTAICCLETMAADRKQRIYTLDGRYVGTDAGVLGRGVYVRDGRKFVR